MEMSRIDNCSMSSCTYNANRECHTFAISVGPHALCNTFYMAKLRAAMKNANGGVGACVASDCKYNEKLECNAGNIKVGNHDAHADCKTYSPRR